jgi:Tfp pilus assembly protein PilF
LEDILANAYLNSGGMTTLSASLTGFSGINPRYPLAHYRLGQAYEKKGQPAQARRAYDSFWWSG